MQCACLLAPTVCCALNTPFTRRPGLLLRVHYLVSRHFFASEALPNEVTSKSEQHHRITMLDSCHRAAHFDGRTHSLSRRSGLLRVTFAAIGLLLLGVERVNMCVCVKR